MIRQTAKACFAQSSKRWDWTRKCINRVLCRHVSPMRRTTSCLLRAMPTTKKPTKAIVRPRCLPYAIFTAATGSVAGRRMPWISTICCSIPYLLFRDRPEVLARYRSQFRYMLVDEYQDTNYAQHSIVLQLAKENQHVCVVGDDAQSIYSFRGADIDNILYFTKVYPGTKVFKLEQNYRSTQTIVSCRQQPDRKERTANSQRGVLREGYGGGHRGVSGIQ